MSKPIGGARKSIKNQEGQGMLDIDENSSVEDDMFENVKTDEDSRARHWHNGCESLLRNRDAQAAHRVQQDLRAGLRHTSEQRI